MHQTVSKYQVCISQSLKKSKKSKTQNKLSLYVKHLFKL